MRISKFFGFYHYVLFLKFQLIRYLNWLADRRGLKDSRRLFRKTGLLDKRNLSANFLSDIKSNWKKHYGRPVNPLWHIAIANFTGKEDWRYIPQDLWFSEVLPYFNNMSMRPAYLDKNLADVLMNLNMRTPKTVVKCMHGRYYTAEHLLITGNEVFDLIRNESHEMIIKSSKTDNGTNIRQLQTDGRQLYLSGKMIGIKQLETKFGKDFIIQHRIKQHNIMAEPHPHSLNTIRLVTFRWLDSIQILATIARFGSGGKITDNGATGGVACGIDKQGKFKSFAIDKGIIKHQYHPTSNYFFGKGETVPSFDKLCFHAMDLHKQLYHFDIVSWDFAIDEGGDPVFMEVNYRGACFRYQLVSEKPLFGELTEEVLNILKINRSSSGKKILNHQM